MCSIFLDMFMRPIILIYFRVFYIFRCVRVFHNYKTLRDVNFILIKCLMIINNTSPRQQYAYK